MTPETLKRKWLKQEELEIDTAIEALFQHRHGRRLIWYVLELGRIGQNAYANNALAMAFTCGEQNVGQRFLDRITAVAPQGYVNMMKEMNDERTEHERAYADALASARTSPDTDSDGDAGAD